MTPVLHFGTEASHDRGMGHFMRCFALAEEGHLRGIHSVFHLDHPSDAMRDRMATIGARHVETAGDWREACLRQPVSSGDWWIIDSYDITVGFLERLSRRTRVLCFDDLCNLPHYPCDLVLNASPHADSLSYGQRLPASARLLAGSAYSQIRQEFRDNARPVSSGGSDGRPVTVILGGSDAAGQTIQAVTTLRQALPTTALEVILGPAAVNTDLVHETARTLGGVTVHVNPPNLAAILAASGLVVTAAGGTLGELCALRQAALALVVADNQASALEGGPFPVLDARGGLPANLVPVVRALLADPPALDRMRQRAHALVDGHGSGRTLDAILGIP